MPQNTRTCGTLLALAGVVLLLGAAALDGAAAGQRDALPADGGSAKVRALAGELQQVTVSGRPHELQPGDMLIMPADEPHALRATSRCKMLLVMIRS